MTAPKAKAAQDAATEAGAPEATNVDRGLSTAPEVLVLSREVVGGIGMTPGEARFIGKMLGKPMKGWGDLDDADQFQVSIFLKLARDHPEQEKSELWERAENTPARFEAPEEEAPPIDPLASFGEPIRPPAEGEGIDPLPDEGSEP